MTTMTRRNFVGGAIAAATAGCVGTKVTKTAAEPKFFKGMLVHLGSNMWCDKYTNPKEKVRPEKWSDSTAVPYLRAEDEVWREVTEALAANGYNAVVVDIGESLIFPCHPEIAVKGSWSPAKMRRELDRLRSLGLEPIPKLNFSSTHNAWMGKHRWITGSDEYLRIQRELILDAAEVFEGPRLFHLGWDEETCGHQTHWGNYEFCVVRRGDKWWYDFNKSVEAVRETGAQAWCFSDEFWYDPDGFRKNMPKDVVQCPWHCVESKEHPEWISTITEMGQLGYTVIADVSTYRKDMVTKENSKWVYHPVDHNAETEVRRMMKQCLKDIPKPQLKGFLACPWAKLQKGIGRDIYLDSAKYCGDEFARFERAHI